MTNLIFNSPLTNKDIERFFHFEKFGRPNKAYKNILFWRIRTKKYKRYREAFSIYLNDTRASRFTYDNSANMSLWLHVGNINNDCSIHTFNSKGKHDIIPVTITDLAYAEEISTLMNCR